MSALDDLTTAVNNNTTAVQAAIAAGVGGASGTPDSALEPLTAQLVDKNEALTAATSGTAVPPVAAAEPTADVGASTNPPA